MTHPNPELADLLDALKRRPKCTTCTPFKHSCGQCVLPKSRSWRDVGRIVPPTRLAKLDREFPGWRFGDRAYWVACCGYADGFACAHCPTAGEWMSRTHLPTATLLTSIAQWTLPVGWAQWATTQNTPNDPVVKIAATTRSRDSLIASLKAACTQEETSWGLSQERASALFRLRNARLRGVPFDRVGTWGRKLGVLHEGYDQLFDTYELYEWRAGIVPREARDDYNAILDRRLAPAETLIHLLGPGTWPVRTS